MNFWREWTKFKNGHQGYGQFFLNFLQFTVIIYNLFILQTPPLNTIFPHFTIFALVFAAAYIPSMWIIGRIHFSKRGPFEEQQRLANETNPWVRDMSAAFTAHMKGDTDGAIQIMRRWLR